MDLSLFGAFIAGILSTLTPCVYPLIPVTLAIIKADHNISRRTALLNAAYYSFGIFFTYTALGLLAVFSGGFFGDLWASEYFRAMMAVFLLILSLYTAEIIKFKPDGIVSSISSRLSAKTYFGTFGMGAVSGLLAAPCTGPLLAAILAYAASHSDKSRGLILLVFYAFGFSLPFMALASFPGLIRRMPRSGNWLHSIKFIIAACLAALAASYLQLPQVQAGRLLSVLCTVLLIGCFYAIIQTYKKYNANKALVFVLLCISGAALSILSTNFTSKSGLQIAENLSGLNFNSKPKMLFFTADWCVKCNEIKSTFGSDSSLSELLDSFQVIEVDLTDITEQERELQEKLSVRGLPSIIFTCPDLNKELDTRITEVLDAKDLRLILASAADKINNCSSPY